MFLVLISSFPNTLLEVVGEGQQLVFAFSLYSFLVKFLVLPYNIIKKQKIFRTLYFFMRFLSPIAKLLNIYNNCQKNNLKSKGIVNLLFFLLYYLGKRMNSRVFNFIVIYMHTYTQVDCFSGPGGICTELTEVEGVTRVTIEQAKSCREETFPTKIKDAKPFVKWAGGKRQLIPTIGKFVAIAYEKAIDTYVEPFVGGGAVLFWILNNYSHIKQVVINDINVDLMSAYQVVRNNPKELIEALADLQRKYYSIKVDERIGLFKQVRDTYNKKELDPVVNTSYFIFLNRTCFNGLYRVNRKGLFNVPFGKYGNPTICDETNINACSRLLKKVEILCGDYSQTIGYANRHSLYYFDPPYKPLSMTSNFTSYSTTA